MTTVAQFAAMFQRAIRGEPELPPPSPKLPQPPKRPRRPEYKRYGEKKGGQYRLWIPVKAMFTTDEIREFLETYRLRDHKGMMKVLQALCDATPDAVTKIKHVRGLGPEEVKLLQSFLESQSRLATYGVRRLEMADTAYQLHKLLDANGEFK